jgi:hypothetical protein
VVVVAQVAAEAKAKEMLEVGRAQQEILLEMEDRIIKCFFIVIFDLMLIFNK